MGLLEKCVRCEYFIHFQIFPYSKCILTDLTEKVMKKYMLFRNIFSGKIKSEFKPIVLNSVKITLCSNYRHYFTTFETMLFATLIWLATIIYIKNVPDNCGDVCFVAKQLKIFPQSTSTFALGKNEFYFIF